MDIPGGPKGVAPPGCLTWAADIKKQCDEALSKPKEEKSGLMQLNQPGVKNENGTLMPFAPAQPATKDMWSHCKNFMDIPGGPQGVAPAGCLTRAGDISRACDEATKPKEEKKGLMQVAADPYGFNPLATKDSFQYCKNFMDIPGGPNGKVTTGCLTRASEIREQAEAAAPPSKDEEKKKESLA